MFVFWQLATGPAVHAYGRKALDAALSGISFHYAKPLLAAEVRRILPTALGLPMELSFYTAAVAAAAVECKFHQCNSTNVGFIWSFLVPLHTEILFVIYSPSHCVSTSA